MRLSRLYFDSSAVSDTRWRNLPCGKKLSRRQDQLVVREELTEEHNEYDKRRCNLMLQGRDTKCLQVCETSFFVIFPFFRNEVDIGKIHYPHIFHFFVLRFFLFSLYWYIRMVHLKVLKPQEKYRNCHDLPVENSEQRVNS